MWLWQQPKLAKKTKFIGKLIALSFFAHVIGVFCFLFMYKEYNSSILQIQSVAQNIIVRVMPLSGMPQKKIQRTVTSMMPQKKNKRAQTKAPTLLKKEKTVPKKVEPVKEINKPLKKKNDLLPSVKSPEPVNSKVVKKEIKKVERIKEVIQKKEIVKQEASLPSSAKREQDEIPPKTREDQVVSADLQEDIKYLTQKEYNAFTAQESLQEAIADVWAPPAGMAKNLVCLVSLTVDWNGKLKEYKIDDSSGVAIYDIAVEQAVQEVKIPRTLWGKSVTVAFKP